MSSVATSSSSSAASTATSPDVNDDLSWLPEHGQGYVQRENGKYFIVLVWGGNVHIVSKDMAETADIEIPFLEFRRNYEYKDEGVTVGQRWYDSDGDNVQITKSPYFDKGIWKIKFANSDRVADRNRWVEYPVSRFLKDVVLVPQWLRSSGAASSATTSTQQPQVGQNDSAAAVRQPKAGEFWYNSQDFIYIESVYNYVNYWRIGDIKTLRLQRGSRTSHSKDRFHADGWQFYPRGPRVGQQASSPLPNGTRGTIEAIQHSVGYIEIKMAGDWYQAGGFVFTDSDSSDNEPAGRGAAPVRQLVVGQIWIRNNLGVRKVFIIVKKDDERMVLLDINDSTTREFYFQNGREFKSDYTFVDRGVRIGDEWSENNWMTHFTILNVQSRDDGFADETYYVQVKESLHNRIVYRELLPLARDVLEDDRKFTVRIGDGDGDGDADSDSSDSDSSDSDNESAVRRFRKSRVADSDNSFEFASDSDLSDSENEPAGRDGSASSSSGTSLASAPAPVPPKRGQLWKGFSSYVVVVNADATTISAISPDGVFEPSLKDFTKLHTYVGEFEGSQWEYTGPTAYSHTVTVYLNGRWNAILFDKNGIPSPTSVKDFLKYKPTLVAVGSNAKKRKRGTSSSSREAKKRATKEAQDMGKCPICQDDMGIVEEVKGKNTNYFQLQKDGRVRIGDEEVKVLVCCNAAIHYECFLQLIKNRDECPLCTKSLAGGVRDPLDVKIVGCRQITQIVYRCRHLKF